jgi:hypothetical protein
MGLSMAHRFALPNSRTWPRHVARPNPCYDRVMRFVRAWLVILVLAPCFACGGGSGGGPEPNGVGDPVQPVLGSPPVDGLLDSLCTFIARCDGVSRKLGCVQGEVGATGRWLADLASAVAAGTIVYRQDVGAECASLAMNATCTAANFAGLIATCESAFVGQTAEGGTCHVSDECVGGADCTGACAPWETISCCTGTCSAPTSATPKTPAATVSDGQPCSSTGAACELLTSYCEAASGTCQPRLPLGAKCTYDQCVGYAYCRNGSCVKSPELGESCKESSGAVIQCQVGGCDDNSNRCMVTTALVRCF